MQGFPSLREKNTFLDVEETLSELQDRSIKVEKRRTSSCPPASGNLKQLAPAKKELKLKLKLKNPDASDFEVHEGIDNGDGSTAEPGSDVGDDASPNDNMSPISTLATGLERCNCKCIACVRGSCSIQVSICDKESNDVVVHNKYCSATTSVEEFKADLCEELWWEHCELFCNGHRLENKELIGNLTIHGGVLHAEGNDKEEMTEARNHPRTHPTMTDDKINQIIDALQMAGSPEEVRQIAYGFDGCGSFLLQKLAPIAANEGCETHQDMVLTAFETEDDVQKASKDKSANFLLQKIVSLYPQQASRIARALRHETFMDIAQHKCGCRVICRLIKQWPLLLCKHFETDKQASRLANSRHGYGKHVVITFLKELVRRRKRPELERVAGLLYRSDFSATAGNKDGSRVVEVLIDKCGDDIGRRTLTKLLDSGGVRRLLDSSVCMYILSRCMSHPNADLASQAVAMVSTVLEQEGATWQRQWRQGSSGKQAKNLKALQFELQRLQAQQAVCWQPQPCIMIPVQMWSPWAGAGFNQQYANIMQG